MTHRKARMSDWFRREMSENPGKIIHLMNTELFATPMGEEVNNTTLLDGRELQNGGIRHREYEALSELSQKYAGKMPEHFYPSDTPENAYKDRQEDWNIAVKVEDRHITRIKIDSEDFREEEIEKYMEDFEELEYFNGSV